MSSTTLSIEDAIARMLTRPECFMYYGNLPLFERWGLTGMGKTRDAGPLEVSNFHVVTEDLLERFPAAFVIEHFGHYTHGWVDQLAVDTTNRPAVQAALDWAEKLKEYPVADEEDFSRREWAAKLAAVDCYIDSLRDEVPPDWRQQVLTACDYCELLDDGSLNSCPPLQDVAHALGFIEPTEDELVELEANRSPCSNPDQLTLWPEGASSHDIR